jgi:hypothetical protein
MEPLDYLNPDLDQFQKDIDNTITPNYIGITRAFAPPVTQEELRSIDRTGIMNNSMIDDAGLILSDYEDFEPVAKPGLNLDFARQLGSTALGLLTGNPLVGLIAKGLGALGERTGLTGVVGGQNLRGDTGFDTFRRSTSLADFFQRQRDKKAAEEAARRGSIKELQSRIDAGKEFNTGKFDKGITDRNRGKYGGDGEGGGVSAPGSGAHGMAGRGASDFGDL